LICLQAALVAGNNCPVCSASYFSPIVERTASDNHEKAAAGATSLSNHTDHTMRGAEEQSPNSANGVNAQEEDEEAPVVVAARAESVQVSGHELKMCPSCYAGSFQALLSLLVYSFYYYLFAPYTLQRFECG